MDTVAIANASDELLKEMGLSKAGDCLSLKGFCAHQEDESSSQEGNKNRKRALLEAFLSRKKEKNKAKSKSKSTASSIKEPPSQKTKKVYLGWKHFKEKEQVYVLVPLVKGGGSRVVEMALTNCKMDIYQTCKKLFFPEGNSIYGNEDDMLFSLTNFKGEEVEESIKVGKEYIPFNLCNYMEAHKVRTIRLYLQSRKIDSSDDDDDDLPSVFDLDQDSSLFGPHLKRQSLVSPNQESLLIDSTLDGQSLVSPNQESSIIDSTLDRQSLVSQNQESLLIGSTLERQSLVSEQDKEYEELLKADERKAVLRERENEESKRKERIQNARANRVLPEPDYEFVTVKVRHITMGLQSRKFPKTACMAAVYDWAGSLSPDPENFTINHLGLVQKPSEALSDTCTYLMVEEEHGTQV